MLPELIPVPPGLFTMGHLTYREASPLHRIDLNGFKIAKFPTTNAEYIEFIADGGYQTQRHWTQIGWRWLESRHLTEPGFWNDPQFNAARQPVVGVSWYEAMAYCNWLDEKYARRFRLPSEARWEKAARGTNDVRIYPWGDRFEANRANTAELGLGRTTQVDAFPDNISPYGVCDLAGNVFEWTLSKWGKNWQEMEYSYPYHADDGREEVEGSAARVMRGGSWFNPASEAQLWLRARYLAGSRGSNIGFRIMEME
jgi:formylglycine-generating enzyme required for sulfatase activity